MPCVPSSNWQKISPSRLRRSTMRWYVDMQFCRMDAEMREEGEDLAKAVLGALDQFHAVVMSRPEPTANPMQQSKGIAKDKWLEN